MFQNACNNTFIPWVSTACSGSRLAILVYCISYWFLQDCIKIFTFKLEHKTTKMMGHSCEPHTYYRWSIIHLHERVQARSRLLLMSLYMENVDDLIGGSLFSPKKLDQYDRPRVLGCEPVDGVLDVLRSNQLRIATFVHQMRDVCVSSIWWTKVAIFIWFVLRITSTPSTGSHPSTLGLSYWPSSLDKFWKVWICFTNIHSQHKSLTAQPIYIYFLHFYTIITHVTVYIFIIFVGGVLRYSYSIFYCKLN